MAGYTQSRFTEALLITKENDTLECEILQAAGYNKKITYRMGQHEQQRFISVKKIKSIQTERTYWENIPLAKGEQMMNLVTDGTIRLFNYVTWVASGPVLTGPTGNYSSGRELMAENVWQKDGVFYQITKKNLKELVTKLMSDCPAVIEKVKNKEYTIDSMGTLVKEYNSCN